MVSEDARYARAVAEPDSATAVFSEARIRVCQTQDPSSEKQTEVSIASLTTEEALRCIVQSVDSVGPMIAHAWY